MMGILADMVIDRAIGNRRRAEQAIKKRILRDMSDPYAISNQVFYKHYR